MGNTEPKLGILCNQVKLPVVGLGHQTNYKTYNLQFVLSEGYAGIAVALNLWEWPIND